MYVLTNTNTQIYNNSGSSWLNSSAFYQEKGHGLETLPAFKNIEI